MFLHLNFNGLNFINYHFNNFLSFYKTNSLYTSSSGKAEIIVSYKIACVATHSKMTTNIYLEFFH